MQTPTNVFEGTNPSSFSPQPTNLSVNEVSRIVGSPVKQGEAVKGGSRIQYVPYQKKVIEYEERQYVQRKPKVRKVLNYQQRKVVQEIPREVTTTDYYAIENITQYYKQIIPQKKIEMVPVEKKIKKIQYVPVEKQIVHYPEGHDPSSAQNQSRLALQSQGVVVRQDAEFRPIDPKLIYTYSMQYKNNPIGYVEDGYQRNLSTAPTLPFSMNTLNGSPSPYGGYYTGPSQTSIYTNDFNFTPKTHVQNYPPQQDMNGGSPNISSYS